MSAMDTVFLVVSMAFVVGISSILPITAYKDYREEKARNEALQRTAVANTNRTSSRTASTKKEEIQ